MKTVAEWLETVVETYEVKNQSALARLLGVTRSSISQNKEGRHAINVTTALKIADLIGVDPLLVIASTMHEQERSEAGKAIWSKAYKFAQENDRREPSKRTGLNARHKIYLPPAAWSKPG